MYIYFQINLFVLICDRGKKIVQLLTYQFKILGDTPSSSRLRGHFDRLVGCLVFRLGLCVPDTCTNFVLYDPLSSRLSLWSRAIHAL